MRFSHTARSTIFGVATAGAVLGTVPVVTAAAAPGAQAAQLTASVQQRNPNPLLAGYYDRGQWVQLANQARYMARVTHNQDFTRLANLAGQENRQDAQLGRTIAAIRVPHPVLTQYLVKHDFDALKTQAAYKAAHTYGNPYLKGQYQKAAQQAGPADTTQDQIRAILSHLGNRVIVR